MILDHRKALVVYSGGQDSTTCLFWAKQHFDEVYALCFRYGQKHVIEVDMARSIAEKAGIPFEVRDVSFISVPMDKEPPTLSSSSPDGRITPPNTFVPGRNLFFLSIAAVYAREHGIMNLVTGVSQTDYSGYPDCRDSFIRSLNVSLNLAMDEQFVIHTPLMWIDKAETWKLADDLGVFDTVRNETLTCYNGIKGDGCGECPACKLRRQGLETYLKIRKS